MTRNIQKLIKIIFALLMSAVAAYFIFGELLLLPEGLDDVYVCREYTGEWERVTETGEREPVQVPGECEADRNETVILETKLPGAIEPDGYLCFRSAKQDMKIYIDGVLRREYSTKESRLFGNMSAVAFVFLEVTGEDAGKVLRMEARTDSSYSGIFYPVYYGNPMGVWVYLFKQVGLELIAAFITLILSIIAIFAGITIRFCYGRKVPLEYLGWGVLIAAVWLITNSSFRQLIFPNLSVVNDMAFLMIMLLALPYLLYVDEIQKERYSRVYQAMEGIVIFNFLLCAILHMTGLRDFTDTIGYVSLFCILSILVIIGTILQDFRRGHVGEYKFVAVGMFFSCGAAFVQIIIYFNRRNLFNGVILAVGLIILLFFATVSTIHEIMYIDLEKQQALLASESKGRFLANMSHEIRTPINAILGMDAMILRESREAHTKEYALDIRNAGQTLLSLINDILDISKIESGKLEIIPAEYDVSSLIHDVVNMIEMKAKDKGLELHLSVDQELPSRLWGDDVRIRQILVNLLNNAVKYTEQGSVALIVKSAVKEDMAHVMFRVEDTGIGIRREDMERLFGEFERIDEKRNRNIEGTGLGMSIATQLLDRMGSRLNVESEYGKGTAFSFTLEQRIASSEPVGDLEQRIKNQAVAYSYQAMFTAPEAWVLVVDDNTVNRRVLVNLLKPTKINVDEASGGQECLELVREKTYDLIFLDHMMPDINGIEVLHRMKEWKDYPNEFTPVVALTANAVSGAKEMYLKEGFANFLSKPVKPEKLEKMIMDILPGEKVTREEKKDAGLEPEKDAWVQEEPLPELEGLDWNYAKLYCKELSILKDTINHFYGMIESEAAQLENFLEMILKSEEDALALSQFRIKVHSMKNSAAMIGAVSQAGVARMLEYAARDGKTDRIKNITPAFLQEWRKLKEILKPVAERGNVSEGKEEPDYGQIKELFHLLRGAMGEMDVDEADEIVRQLKRFAYPKGNKAEAMEKICLAVTDLDEEQVSEWIEKFEQDTGGNV